MPVIITEFEAVAEPPARTSSAAPDAAEPASKKAMIEPYDIKPALAVLKQQVLRCWAH